MTKREIATLAIRIAALTAGLRMARLIAESLGAPHYELLLSASSGIVLALIVWASAKWIAAHMFEDHGEVVTFTSRERMIDAHVMIVSLIGLWVSITSLGSILFALGAFLDRPIMGAVGRVGQSHARLLFAPAVQVGVGLLVMFFARQIARSSRLYPRDGEIQMEGPTQIQEPH
ncbi:MAG: hypothetical protein ABR507_00305 [Actinomycetota bacterium]|nr:hypothetical protein [Actinomycetota bacterium]